MADLIQLRRDKKETWERFNPILAEGEIGIVLDYPNQYKIGDGINFWNDLPIRGFNGNIVELLGEDSNSVVSQKFFSQKIRELSEKIEQLSAKINQV